MKSTIKKVLIKLGAIERARLIYNSAKSASKDVIKEEIKYKKHNLPDGYPAPPKELIFLIIGLGWKSVYYNSGRQIYTEMESLFSRNGIDFASFERVLDFGCGCGRIIRHFNNNLKSVKLAGTDYNTSLITWCRDNLTFGDFRTNKLAPPIDFEDNSFDLLYARSVFTHLTRELQGEWMKEFRRVIKTGGYLYITTHGLNTFTNLTGDEKKELNNSGIITINKNIEGDNKCSTYQTKEFVLNNLAHGFELVSFTPGQSRTASPQDIYILKKI